MIGLNVRRARVPDPDRPDGEMLPAQCVSCQGCGRAETVAHHDTPHGTCRDARGEARRKLLAGCPRPGARHLTTPCPAGVTLSWLHRGKRLPLYVTRQWDVCSLSGPIAPAVEIRVEYTDPAVAAAAERFAERLTGREYKVTLKRPRSKGATNHG